MIDVLVVGGGPVGLVSALQLHRAGLSVTVVEQRESPIDKACGEGLMPAAVRALNTLDVKVTGFEFAGIRYLDRQRSVLAPFIDGAGRGVRRTALQAALEQAVTDAGIPIERARVADVEQDGTTVTAAGISARYLVAADGLHSPIRRQLGLEQTRRGRPRWGQRQHYPVSPWADAVEVYWSDSAEAYVTPLADNLIGVAVLTGNQAPFDQILQAFPQLVDRLGGASGAGVRGAGPLRQRVSRRVAGRVLLVGDAAGYVDALTGEGLAVGFSCAAALAGCLAADQPERYERSWRRATRRPRLLTEGLLLAAQHRLARKAIVPAAHAMPWFYRQIVNQLAG